VVKNLFRFRCDVLLGLSSDSRAMLLIPFTCRSGLDVGGAVSSMAAGAGCSPLGERWSGVWRPEEVPGNCVEGSTGALSGGTTV